MVHDSDLVSIQEVRTKVELAWAAWQQYQHFSQQQVDTVVESVAAAAREHALELARMAVQETGYGNVKDKVAKNLLCADLLPKSLRGMKTVGILRQIPEQKVTEIGVPMGVVGAILPTTNPTSTAIYKTIIALKSGNAIVLSPHPRAKKCTCYVADLLLKAAVAAGAPDGLIQCVTDATLEGTNAMIHHPRVAVILATGGNALVKAAYGSGKPAFGVGPGNVPVLLDSGYSVADCVEKVVTGKSFDYGTVCSSEQTLVAEASRRDEVLAELRRRKAYIATGDQARAIEKVLFKPNFRVSPECVGQSPTKIARMAGFEVPPETSILVVEIAGVGREYPLSAEKLSPVLALHFVKDFEAGVKACADILRFGGLGHTCVIYSNDAARVEAFGLQMPAHRVLVNTPAPQGSTGITTAIAPAMTLGCGAVAGNATGDNVTPLHLINIKRIAWTIRRPEEAFQIPEVDSSVPLPVARCSSSSCAVPAAAPAASVPPPTTSITRDTIVQAVERYLASRGLTRTETKPVAALPLPPPPPPAPVPVAPAPAPVVSPVPAAMALRTAEIVSEVVARVMAKQRAAAAAAAAQPGAPPPQAAPAPQPEPAPSAAPAQTAASEPAPAAAAPPQPKIAIVDFVCEADVREAAAKKKKIFIGRKTIVTPSARELGAELDIIVLAER